WSGGHHVSLDVPAKSGSRGGTRPGAAAARGRDRPVTRAFSPCLHPARCRGARDRRDGNPSRDQARDGEDAPVPGTPADARGDGEVAVAVLLRGLPLCWHALRAHGRQGCRQAQCCAALTFHMPSSTSLSTTAWL